MPAGLRSGGFPRISGIMWSITGTTGQTREPGFNRLEADLAGPRITLEHFKWTDFLHLGIQNSQRSNSGGERPLLPGESISLIRTGLSCRGPERNRRYGEKTGASHSYSAQCSSTSEMNFLPEKRFPRCWLKLLIQQGLPALLFSKPRIPKATKRK